MNVDEVAAWLREHPDLIETVMGRLKVLGPWDEGFNCWERVDMSLREDPPYPILHQDGRWWDANAACPGEGYPDHELGESWTTFAEAKAAMDARAIAAGWVLMLGDVTRAPTP